MGIPRIKYPEMLKMDPIPILSVARMTADETNCTVSKKVKTRKTGQAWFAMAATEDWSVNAAMIDSL